MSAHRSSLVWAALSVALVAGACASFDATGPETAAVGGTQTVVPEQTALGDNDPAEEVPTPTVAPTPESGIVLGSDPTSTIGLGSGGGSMGLIEFDELVAQSTAALEVTVVDIRRSRVNTLDGAYPEIDTAQGTEQLVGLHFQTEIELRIERVLGDRGDLDGVLQPGENTVITVGGGEVEIVLTPAEARALGVLVSPEGTEQGELLGDLEGVPLEESEPEVFPTEPITILGGVTPPAKLTEGERLLVFLNLYDRAAFPESDGPVQTLSLTHAFGIFRAGDDGRWRSQFLPDTGVDIEELARSVGDR